MSTPHVVVVGSGPSGLYTVAALLASQQSLHIDVIDRLPTPYGLVRYGVAPDHAKIKAVSRLLAKPFTNQHVRFIGNVEVGRDISHEELTEHYDSVIYASGAEHDRLLNIPGEDLTGCIGSSKFVRWYNGHPDAAESAFELDTENVVVVGAGNVALDVARILARTAEELHGTDVPDRVLASLDRSKVRDIHVLIRRGPADAKVTPAELLQLSTLADATVLVHDGGHGIDNPGTAPDKRIRENLEILQTFAESSPQERRRRIHLHFWTSPIEVEGVDSISGVVTERNVATPAGKVVGTGAREHLDAALLISAVGFRASPLQNLPFDEDTGTVPNTAGRVERDGVRMPGVYVTGWLKRGPSGVIGTNKPDGAQTAASVLEDLAQHDRAPQTRPDITELLAARPTTVVDWERWLRLEAYEGQLGAASGRGRVKVPDLASMLHYSTT
ncbi:FAD-dependent oxidoreductase [Rhodococcus opacus]|uniref:FAD-dependent oxidoreductase n=1 Tax=Rhodococcus opacus TaxID=37919 RepID=UPI002474D323|nr:FAD-dependent oxidoreductase [Rhodococcus opacus]MDH6288227.1 ferredoxin--NADP+ reductase [Rhodococcus opacus]